MVLQLSRSLLQAEWTVPSPDVVPLTAQEGLGQPVSEHKMGCRMKTEERWAGIKLPSCCYLEPVTGLHNSFFPQGTQVRRAIFL